MSKAMLLLPQYMTSWLLEHKFTFYFVSGIGHRAVPSAYSARSISWWLHSYSGTLGENYFDMITDNTAHVTISMGNNKLRLMMR